MKNILFTILLISSFSISAQSIFGTWENRDEETNKVDSVIEVYKKDGMAFAKIIEITDKKNQTARCEECKGKYKNASILGMNILSGLKKKVMNGVRVRF